MRPEPVPESAKCNAKQPPEHAHSERAHESKAHDKVHRRVYGIRVWRQCKVYPCHYGSVHTRDYRLLCIHGAQFAVEEHKPERAKSRYCKEGNIQALPVVDGFRVSYRWRVCRVL